MIDDAFKVRRYITVFSKQTDSILTEHDLSYFDLIMFQKEFCVHDQNSPMFDCYPIKEKNTNFLKNYLEHEPVWDFKKNEYFVEAESL